MMSLKHFSFVKQLGGLGLAFTILFLSSHSALRAQSLVEVENKVGELVEENQKAVVGIDWGGSGVIVSADGLILTAAHVVNGRSRNCAIQMPDGRVLRARKLGLNANRDAAMVQLIDEGPWPFAEVRFKPMSPAEWVVAMGHPQGFNEKRKPPVRFGRVIKPHRNALGPLGFMMTDCTITGGDSGGPLFDLEGKVVGIHSFVASSLFENFHVPMTVFQRDWDKMYQGERWGDLSAMDTRPPNPAQIHETPYLGVILDPEFPDSAVIKEVKNASPADNSGMKAKDKIIAIDGIEIDKVDKVREIISEAKIGDEIILKILRDNENEFEIKTALSKHIGFRKSQDFGDLIDQMNKGFTIPKEFEDDMSEAILEVEKSTVAMISGKSRIAHGVILSSDGWILTKASETSKLDDIKIKTSDDKTYKATFMDSVQSLDLALFKAQLKGKELTPINWPGHSAEVVDVGDFVVSPTVTEEDIVYLGVISVKERAIERDKGFLGVVLGQGRDGDVFIRDIVPDCPAQKAGIRSGDILLKVNDEIIESSNQAIDEIGQYEPGDNVTFLIDRDDKDLEFEVVLESRVNKMPIAFNMEGGRFSKIRNGFKTALQHDIPLTPEDCGSPIVNSKGQLVGINIARSSRIRSFALPIHFVSQHLTKTDKGSWKLIQPRQDVEKMLKRAKGDLDRAKKNVLRLQKLLNELDSE